MRKEVDGWRGVKAEEAAAEEKKSDEDEEEERRIVWDRREMIGRWVDEEAKRRVRVAEARGRADQGKNGEGGRRWR